MAPKLIDGVPTLEKQAKRSRDGRMRIPYDAIFGGEIRAGSAPLGGDFTELNHQRWTSDRSVVGEMGSARVVSEMAMQDVKEEFLKDALEAELLQSVSEMITTSQGSM